MDDQQAASRIRADRCDILIDLGGHTHGNRLGILALRPAPVQATYLGYPATTGLTSIEYRITDDVCDPFHWGNPYCTERLARIPGCFLCYRPGPHAPHVGPPPVDELGRITFGCLNQYPKLSSEIIALWAEILRAVPEARLLLGARSFDDPRTVLLTQARLAAVGIGPSRLELRGFVRPERSHFATYNQIDIALDPFPFNGATTTCEALWMGAPVITLAGRRNCIAHGSKAPHSVGIAAIHH